MYQKDLALNNLQWLMCYKTQPNQPKPISKQLLFQVTIFNTINLQL